MNSEYLDKILFTIRDTYNGRVDLQVFKAENPFVNQGTWPPAFQFLLKKQLIKYEYHGSAYIQITPEGERLLEEGGFTSDSNYRKETLDVAKDSRKYAKLAFYISIVGIIVTIIFFLIDHFSKK